MKQEHFITLLLCLLLAAGSVNPFSVSAQRGESSADALQKKADKLLKHVYQVASDAEPGRASGRVRQDAMYELDDLSRRAGVNRNSDATVNLQTIVELNAGDGSELKAAGFSVGAIVGDIATVECLTSRLPELAAIPSVKRMWASTFRHPLNDRARQTAGIDNASGQRVISQTGRGVVVATIDSGIDFRHPDFTVPGSNGTQTRIKFLLDMTAYNGSTSGWNYTLPGGSAPIGRLYTQANINAALAESPKPAQSSDVVMERDKSGHGTHVAGTAAGNGLGASSAPGVYAGMAPDADLIIVKASRQNDGNDDFGTSDEINALQFIQTKAAELGEPFVINMSLGGQAGPHDGTGPDEIAIDNLVNSGAGRAVCIAAGNNGTDNIHATTSVPAGGSVTLHLNATTNPSTLDLYSAPRGTNSSGRYTVTVTEPDGATLGPLAFNANGFSQGSGQLSDSSVRLWNALDDKSDSDPSNDQADIFLLFKTGAKTGTWTLKIDNVSGEPASTFDAWADGESVSFAEFVDNNSHLVASPGNSRGAITVGAYVARSASQTIGNYAFFTNPGPTADGRQKPEISADGYYLYSSRSSDVSDESIFTYGTGSNALASGVSQTLYGGFAGTSMSTPVVTGSVALLLQANAGLTNANIKSVIENNATRDSFVQAAGIDGSGWNSRFGFGKLNIAAAISSLGSTPSNPIDDSQVFVTQHYQDFLNRQPDSSGLAFWTNNIESCGADTNCRAVKRVDTSAAFFLSIEFQQTGNMVYKMWKAGFGNAAGTPVAIRRANFMTDTQTARSSPNQIIVGQGDWQNQLEQNKQAFALAFVQRPAFQSAHGNQDVNTYVASLFNNAGVTPSGAETSTAVTAFNNAGGGNAGRAAALRSVVDSTSVSNALFNESFVLMQYFGYLQRDPDAPPEPTRDYSGYTFWLNKLNSFGGNYVNAEMVKAFITSSEYRARFGNP
jgi:subtilisin family serine protease